MSRIFWGAHGAINEQANPNLLFLGDSWNWYPKGNLPMAISRGYPVADFVVIGRNGAEANQWGDKFRKEIDFAFNMYASGVQGLFLSGGGNDVVGMADFLRLLQDNCAKAVTVSECYRTAQPDEILSSIISSYRGVILKFRARNPQATVFMHNYENAWPSGKGFFGPSDWLKAPMDKAKVPKGLRRPLFKDILSRLHGAQNELAKEKSIAPAVAIETTGTFPEDSVNRYWDNELHPTMFGFEELADQRILPKLRGLVM